MLAVVAPTSADPISAVPLAVTGTHAPGTEPYVTYSSFPGSGLTFPPAINANGQVSFYANLNDPFASSHLGLWSGTPGNVTLSVRIGDVAPGLGAGATFQSFSLPEFPPTVAAPAPINAAGELVFGAFATKDFNLSDGLWSSANGSNVFVASDGSQAPGNASGVTFNSFGGTTFSSPLISDAGHLGFQAKLSTGDTGIWTGSPARCS